MTASGVQRHGTESDVRMDRSPSAGQVPEHVAKENVPTARRPGEGLESRLLGELKRVQRDCDEAYETALARIDARPLAEALEQPQQCPVALLEQRLDQLQQGVEEKLQLQRRDFEQRLQRISSSTGIAASASESSLLQQRERLCGLEVALDEQIHRGKALTEGVVQLTAQFKHFESTARPNHERGSLDAQLRSTLDDLANRIESQELAHAHMYASVFNEGIDSKPPTPTDAAKIDKMQHLELLVDKLGADVIALEADARLGPQVRALMESVATVAPKLREHEQWLSELRAWRKEQAREMSTTMMRTSATEKQLEETVASTRIDIDALVGEIFRLQAKVDKMLPLASSSQPPRPGIDTAKQ